MRNQRTFFPLIALAVVSALLVSPSFVFAVGSSGFENASYSAKTLSQANAVVARPQDPSAVLFNPAGLVDLPGVQVMGNLQGLDFRVFHKNNLTGDHNQNTGKLLLIPSFFMSANPGELMDNRAAFGVSMDFIDR
jgi:long-subunit fatty acid transport protein